jgi:hypothetical protein
VYFSSFACSIIYINSMFFSSVEAFFFLLPAKT